MLADRLNTRWKQRDKKVPVEASFHLNAEGLVLGAGTVLLPAIGKRRLADVRGFESRLLALLTAAYSRPIQPGILRCIEKAAICWSKGEDARALVHLALSGLPSLNDPEEAARRLFMADQLIDAGFHPANVYLAQGFASAPLATFEKLYDTNEPRAPKGESIGGEWIKELSVFAGRAAIAVMRFAGYLARSNPVTLAFGLLVIPSDSGIDTEGDVPELPGLSYIWNHDEATVVLRYKSDEGTRQFLTSLSAHGRIRDGSAVIGRKLENGSLALDIGAVSRALQIANSNQPQLCPLPSKDKDGKMDEAYEIQLKALVNPGFPTPLGMGYRFLNVGEGKAVVIDDCQRDTGTAFEFKGPGYAELLTHEWGKVSLSYDWLKQSGQQVDSTPGRPLVWIFAEKEAADFATALFSKTKDDRRYILVRFEPKAGP